MLRGVGIYNVPQVRTADDKRQNNDIAPILYAQQEKVMSIFAPSQLAKLENTTLRLAPLQDSNGWAYVHFVEGEFHYLNKNFDDDYILAICSLRKLTALELGNLFTNMRHAHLRGEKLSIKLQDIIDNPLAFTGKDKQLETIQGDLDQVKEAMLKNLDKVIDNAERASALVDRTVQLTADSDKFNRTASRLNRRCCGN